MKSMQGFTLIELMIVVAIIAVLAALALPAYQDYVARSQVAEGYSLASDARTAIVLYHADRSAYPSGNPQAGLADPGSITGNYVESVSVGNGDGRVAVLFGKRASEKINGQTLVMELHNAGGSLRWDCSGLSAQYLPSVCR